MDIKHLYYSSGIFSSGSRDILTETNAVHERGVVANLAQTDHSGLRPRLHRCYIVVLCTNRV